MYKLKVLKNKVFEVNININLMHYKTYLRVGSCLYSLQKVLVLQLKRPYPNRY